MQPMTTPEEKAEKAAYMRAWHARNPRKMKEYELRNRYGMTLDEYDAMLEAQGDTCPICQRQFNPDPKKRDKVIDHDHETGKARGIVCAKCNAILGRTSRDVEILRRAIAYLEGG